MGQTLLSPTITTFFTNKIPCTLEDWFDALVVVASVYNKFDRKEYDREEIIREFSKIATRNETTQRDPSDFRDEYGAYGSYLGIFYVERDAKNSLICHTSRAAKELLCGYNPDPVTFCRLQMALYQYPDGTGIVYQAIPRLQANSAEAKTTQIKDKVLFSPFRVILRFLLFFYEEGLREEAYLTYDEIYFLFNLPDVYKKNLTEISTLVAKIIKNRNEKRVLSMPPKNFKRNFHILEKTGLIKLHEGKLLLDLGSQGEKIDAIKTIVMLDKYFEDFSNLDGSDTEIKRGIINILLSGKWGRYFDGLNLDFDTASTILKIEEPLPDSATSLREAPFPELRRYRLFRFPGAAPQQRDIIPNYARVAELREKRNARHREINDILAKKLINRGCQPSENGFVDLTANLEGIDFIFEVKTSSSTDYLERTREAVSQLLEYKYRARKMLTTPRLVLLIERKPPHELTWLEGYLDELGIVICWMSGELIFAKKKDQEILGSIIDHYV